jgi:hypothetical protein
MGNSIMKLQPTSLNEAMAFAKILSTSALVPKSYQGKPADILVAMQMGDELGLPPMTALRGIAVINGRASLYGDIVIALIKNHPDFVDMIETESADKTDYTCEIHRKGCSPVTSTFSIDDAKRAKLWGKEGPWTQYPQRMLKWRARSWACRDAFPDALGGLTTVEENLDIAEDKPRWNPPRVTEIEEVIPSNVEIINQDTGEVIFPEKEKLNEVLWAFNEGGFTLTTKEKERLESLKTPQEFQNAIAYFEARLRGDAPKGGVAALKKKLGSPKDQAVEATEVMDGQIGIPGT